MATSLGRRAIRSVARAPIRIFQAGFGFLFGHRFLMIEHTGRRSGMPRYVVLEVVRLLPDDRYLVPAGAGNRADWYRNVEKEPHVRIWVGRHQAIPAIARTLDQAEALHHFAQYRAEHQRTWALLRPLLRRLTGRAGQSDEAIFAAIPLVELRPDR